jgi:hypothetical protein
MNAIKVEEKNKMDVEAGYEKLNAMKILDEYYKELWENDCEIIEDVEFLI